MPSVKGAILVTRQLRDEAESPPFAAGANFPGVESDGMKTGELLRRRTEDGCS